MPAASPPPARTVPIDVARDMLADRITPLNCDETVLLHASLGRLAAKDITSAIDLPRTHNAAVDGYGVSAKVLGDDDIAIVIPWHGAITLGANLGEAVSRHVIFDYTARMDVTLPPDVPEMPHKQCNDLKELVEKADYYSETWKLIQRKAKAAYNGSRVVPVVS